MQRGALLNNQKAVQKPDITDIIPTEQLNILVTKWQLFTSKKISSGSLIKNVKEFMTVACEAIKCVC